MSIERWLTPDRATAWLRVLGVMTLVVAAGFLGLSRHGADPTGKPLGNDFLSFWTAAEVTLRFGGAAAYDHLVHGAAQAATLPGVDVGYDPFPYPPTFLLVLAPFALLPYFPALVAWLALTGAAYVKVVRAWAGSAFPAWLPALAFPAVLITAAHGQSAFLTAAIMGAGALLLPRRPFLAGLCFGLVSFKPQLGLLLPLAFVAARQWRAIAGAAISTAALAAASLAAFGLAPWRGFLQSLAFQRGVVEHGLLDPAKLQSTFGALRVWHAPLWAAYGAQAAVTLVAAAAVTFVAWRRPRSPAVGPVVIAGALLSTPYIHDYDLTLVAIPLAWALADAVRTRFLPGERLILFAAYVLPLVSRLFGMKLHLPLAVPVLLALLFVAVRRAWVGEALPAGEAPVRAPADPMAAASRSGALPAAAGLS